MGTSQIYPPQFRQPTQLFRDSFNSQGKMEVQISDQTSPLIIAALRENVGTPAALTVDMDIYDKTVTVDQVTDLVVGHTLLFRDVLANRFSFAQVIDIVGLVITLDTPIDFAYSIATSTIDYASREMAVNGAVTPRVFGLRAGGSPQIATVADITRIIISCTTSSAIDLNKFGDIAGGLLNGVVFRHANGDIINIFNVKQNLGFATMAYDFTVYDASNPVQGINGFVCRLTFAGQSKMGVALRVNPTEDLEMLIQDDLSSLTTFNVVCEGHVVQD